MLEGALIEKDCIGHVFHDIEWEDSIEQPYKDQKFEDLTAGQKEQVRNFWKKDRIAYSIIISRLDESIRPDFGNNRKTAKELMDTIKATYMPVITVDIHQTIRKLHSCKLQNNNTLLYCEEFQHRLQQHKTATEQYAKANNIQDQRSIILPDTYINILFELGTAHTDWLRVWRQMQEPHKKTLQEMITSLRREQPPFSLQGPRPFINNHTNNNASRPRLVAAATGRDNDPCTICTHHSHTNAKCFVQHPEQGKFRNNKGRSQQPARGNHSNRQHHQRKLAATAGQNQSQNQLQELTSEEDYLSAGEISASAIAIASNPGLSSSIILDTGSSFHFFNSRAWFSELSPLREPVSFSLAVGRSTISHSGTVPLQLKNKQGQITQLTLRNVLYSPRSAANLISGALLHTKADTTFNQQNSTLLRKGKEIGWYEMKNLVYVLQGVSSSKKMR